MAYDSFNKDDKAGVRPQSKGTFLRVGRGKLTLRRAHYTEAGACPNPPRVSIYKEDAKRCARDGVEPRVMIVPHVVGARVQYARTMHAAIWCAIAILHDLGVNIATGARYD